VRLHHSQTQSLESPAFGPEVTIYLCGYSPIQPLHLANARPFIVVDQLRHTLEATQGARVRLVHDISDIDARVDARATGQSMTTGQLVDELTAQFSSDLAAIEASPPTLMPKASEHVDEAIRLIEALLERGLAHTDGSTVTLSAIGSSSGDFGSLDPRGQLRQMMCFTGQQWDYRQEVVLWAPRPESSQWQSPWGLGAPSEHVPCAAMAHALLGTTMDIHAGAIDIYPHHEIEMALGELSVDEVYARLWLHTGIVEAEGSRMANSRGNTIGLREAVARYGAGAVRILYLGTHYRQTLDASHHSLRVAQERSARLASLCAPILRRDADATDSRLRDEVSALLDDDLATDRALVAVESALQSPADIASADLSAALRLLQLERLVTR
jgi:cysteinyl-tRNA synthetase